MVLLSTQTPPSVLLPQKCSTCLKQSVLRPHKHDGMAVLVSQFSSARIHELLQSKQMHDADRIRCALAEMDICRDGKVAFAVPAGLFFHALWLFWMQQGEDSTTMPTCVQARLLAQLCDKKIAEGICNAGQGGFPACGEWVSIRSFNIFTRTDPTAAIHELTMRAVDPGTAVYTMGALDWSLLQRWEIAPMTFQHATFLDRYNARCWSFGAACCAA